MLLDLAACARAGLLAALAVASGLIHVMIVQGN
jgi:hypothetical protein